MSSIHVNPWIAWHIVLTATWGLFFLIFKEMQIATLRRNGQYPFASYPRWNLLLLRSAVAGSLAFILCMGVHEMLLQRDIRDRLEQAQSTSPAASWTIRTMQTCTQGGGDPINCAGSTLVLGEGRHDRHAIEDALRTWSSIAGVDTGLDVTKTHQ